MIACIALTFLLKLRPYPVGGGGGPAVVQLPVSLHLAHVGSDDTHHATTNSCAVAA